LYVFRFGRGNFKRAGIANHAGPTAGADVSVCHVLRRCRRCAVRRRGSFGRWATARLARGPLRLEKVELVRVLRPYRYLLLRTGAGGGQRDARVVAFQAGKDVLGAFDDTRRKPGEPRHLDTVASVGGPGHNAPDKHDLVVPFLDRHREVAQANKMLLELRELLVVGCEKGPRASRRVAVQVLDHRPGDAQAVIRRRPAPYLVQDDQRAVGGVVQDVGRLVHLHHEGRVAARKVVAGPDTREYPVHEPDPARRGGDPRANLGHEGDQGDLPDVGRLARHVGPRYQGDLGVAARERGVVGDEGLGAAGAGLARPEALLDHRVAPLADLERVALVDLRPAVAPFAGDPRPSRDDVDFRQGVGRLDERRR